MLVHVRLLAFLTLSGLVSTGTTQSYRAKWNDSTVHSKTELCPCALTSSPTAVCYDFVNEEQKTCTSRPCRHTFTCTNREKATHYCFERANRMVRVTPENPGSCSVTKETIHFRVPYGIFPDENPHGTPIDGTQLEDDLHKLEPEACFS